MIPTKNYYDPEIFQEEMERLFDAHYQFACFASEVENDRDFVCVEYPGCSVVVQNFRGTIKAFQNVCSHRFNKLQTEDKGNRPLTCSYHGWTYDKTGFPVGLPKRDQFLTGDVERDREMLCLTEYAVEMCGKFVFFRKGDGSVSLREYLGEYYGTLEELSRHYGKQVYFGTTPHKCNWKLLVENVVECYHCALVHKDTFLARLGIGNGGIDDLKFAESHSSCHFPRTEVKGEKIRAKLMSHLDGREFSHNSFYHIHIFPNLFLASAEGTFFYIGHAIPVAPGETAMRIRYFGPNVEMTEKKSTLQDMINEESVALGLSVVGEDKGILENIQKAIQLTDKPGIIGDDEVRIRAFHGHYEAIMAGEKVMLTI